MLLVFAATAALAVGAQPFWTPSHALEGGEPNAFFREGYVKNISSTEEKCKEEEKNKAMLCFAHPFLPPIASPVSLACEFEVKSTRRVFLRRTLVFQIDVFFFFFIIIYINLPSFSILLPNVAWVFECRFPSLKAEVASLFDKVLEPDSILTLWDGSKRE